MPQKVPLSVHQELRALIESRFTGKELIPVRSDESRDEALKRIRARWKDLPETKLEEVARWLNKAGRELRNQ